MVSAITSALLDKLDEIESEMKSIGYWAVDPPDLPSGIESGDVANFLAAPSFEIWLQQVFLKNARDSISDNIIPASSEVGHMAQRQYNYHSTVMQALGLLKLLHEFDDMILEFNNN